MDLFTSSNGWLAWITPDPVCQPYNLGQKKYVIVGFLPNGQFSITTDSFESEKQAQTVISSLDQQTVVLEYGDDTVKVFTCFDGSYWWSSDLTSGSKNLVQPMRLPSLSYQNSKGGRWKR